MVDDDDDDDDDVGDRAARSLVLVVLLIWKDATSAVQVKANRRLTIAASEASCRKGGNESLPVDVMVSIYSSEFIF